MRISHVTGFAGAIPFLLLAIGYQGRAVEMSNTLKTPAAARRFHVSATFQASSTLQKTSQDGREALGRLVFAPSFAVTDTYRVEASGAIIQNFNEEQKTSYGNTKIAFARAPIRLTDDTSLSLSAGGRLPTNPEEHRDDTYNGAVLTESGLFSQWSLAGARFSTSYNLTLTKNFHTYDRNNEARTNTEYSLVHYLAFDARLFDRVYFTLDGDYTYARSYQDTVKTIYSIGQTIGYRARDWSVAAGHTNAADMLKANGREGNIAVFDKHTSAVFALARIFY